MQHSRFSHIAAILVLFNPRSDPRAVVAKLTACVGAVVVVDNGTEAHPLGNALAVMSGVRVLHNGNVGGLAGAYNAALRHLESDDLYWTHVVFVDDDSDTAVLADFLADPVNARALDHPGIAAVSPVYRDRATGLRGTHIVLSRFRIRYLPREQRGLVPVAFVINSMSVWCRGSLRTIGPFNEGLAVDSVDIEYCLRARQAGLAVFINGDHEFAHSIGERRKYRVLGVTLQSGGHVPQRRFMIARNTAWMARRYVLAYPAFSLLCLLRLGYEATGILLAEPDKASKLWALARGIAYGLLRRLPTTACVKS